MRDSFLEAAGTVSDEALVGRGQAGERDALEQLFTRHRPWILNVALRMLGRRADATQDVLLRALKSLHSFRGDSRFRTWLYRVAANHLLNIRKNQWTASEAVCSFADASAGLRQVPDFDPPDPRTVPVPVGGAGRGDEDRLHDGDAALPGRAPALSLNAGGDFRCQRRSWRRVRRGPPILISTGRRIAR